MSLSPLLRAVVGLVPATEERVSLARRVGCERCGDPVWLVLDGPSVCPMCDPLTDAERARRDAIRAAERAATDEYWRHVDAGADPLGDDEARERAARIAATRSRLCRRCGDPLDDTGACPVCMGPYGFREVSHVTA